MERLIISSKELWFYQLIFRRISYCLNLKKNSQEKYILCRSKKWVYFQSRTKIPISIISIHLQSLRFWIIRKVQIWCVRFYFSIWWRLKKKIDPILCLYLLIIVVDKIKTILFCNFYIGWFLNNSIANQLNTFFHQRTFKAQQRLRFWFDSKTSLKHMIKSKPIKNY